MGIGLCEFESHHPHEKRDSVSESRFFVYFWYLYNVMDRPLVSIVIVCMDRLDNLRPCLRSVEGNTLISHETLVVAYMFKPEHLKEAKEEFPSVTFIESNELRGFAENNNLALRQATGRFCFILNDDTEFKGPVIDRLVADMGLLPESAAIVSPRLVNADGSLQLCGRPPYPAVNYVRQQWHRYSEPLDDTVGKSPVLDGVFHTSNITGAAFLIKTDIFRELGWFDETYYFTPEDIALSTLAREKGYGVFIDRNQAITHKWKATASRISPAIRPAAVRGSLIFFSRGSRLRYVLLALGVWPAEAGKRVKAAFRCLLYPTDDNRIKLRTFRNITRNIFTRRSPKEIFLRYYNG